jgi:hypothetical protein
MHYACTRSSGASVPDEDDSHARKMWAAKDSNPEPADKEVGSASGGSTRLPCLTPLLACDHLSRELPHAAERE